MYYALYHYKLSYILYDLKCKFCMYETYIGKIVGDHIHVFKTRINNHIIESRSGVST